MKTRLSTLTILLNFYLFAQAQTITNISPTILLETIERNKVQLLDVRTTEEFDGGYIKGATNIDVNAKDFEKQIKFFDTNKPIYVYCLSGGRSANASSILAKNNFKQIYNVTGGIMKWRAEKKPLVVVNLNPSPSMSVAEYNKITSGDKPVLVEFYAPWCAPCKILKPKVTEIGKTYSHKLDVVFIDVDKNKELADALKVGSIPEMRYYKSGKQKLKMVGDQPRTVIIKRLRL